MNFTNTKIQIDSIIGDHTGKALCNANQTYR